MHIVVEYHETQTIDTGNTLFVSDDLNNDNQEQEQCRDYIDIRVEQMQNIELNYAICKIEQNLEVDITVSEIGQSQGQGQ